MGVYLSPDVAKIRKILHVKRDLPKKPYNCATCSQLKATLVSVGLLCYRIQHFATTFGTRGMWPTRNPMKEHQARWLIQQIR